ncbi:hypothetical protein SDRG_00613 [Saprolegnia diclina VS20]|uniref:Glucose-methanol-choline oxidoreductase N-terminal domain-containing protein n=1 Tax=Saprolegnia diclina (strain VS20) TaxID=1156394 RepID=T0QU64_SAPDV|nr:hypothetical protein SDRG_00613 [Saprolegnia diclina VS20]EQC41749.1 hypothetical protein SDRG_00613 [Saprolegnia diclina VS20]|eukprot:XP_008604318.1 hypothetical protein SDRG_00613 [Saprolegnia diclina VS20]
MLRRRALVVVLTGLASSVNAAYDVIVIGSGPGGLVAAEYLTRDPDVQLLLLEAGGPSVRATGGNDVPSYAATAGLTRFDIPGEYTSVAFQPSSVYRPDWIASPATYIGKVVGGSSSLNGMLYFRPSDDYVASASWPNDIAEVQAGFAAIEAHFNYTSTPSTDKKRYLQEAYTILASSFSAHGFSEKPDLNAVAARNRKAKTFGHPPFAINDGLRASPAATLVATLNGRPNFTLRTFATVQHIVHVSGTASSVVYMTSSGQATAALTSRGVVLLAAGALSTPKVLIQSNIGPRAQLTLLHMTPSLVRDAVTQDASTWVLNENVGGSLFDTAEVMLTLDHPEMVTYTHGSPSASELSLFLLQRSGPYASPDPVFIGYDDVLINGRRYECQITGFCHGFQSGASSTNYGLAIYLNNPQSRDAAAFAPDGAWRGDSAKSLYLRIADDAAALGQCTTNVLAMLSQANSTPVVPDTKANVSQWTTTHVAGTNHYGGSCYASRDDRDDRRCSDGQLRVRGTRNIYLGDASVMKEGTVNPCGWVMYVGYQAAVNIRAQWGTPMPLTSAPLTPSAAASFAFVSTSVLTLWSLGAVY